MKNFLFLIVAMCLHISAFAQQGLNAKYLSLTPSALTTPCGTGTLRFDVVTSQLEFCDANVWTAFSAVGGGGTGLGYINPFATLVGAGSGAIQMIGPGSSGFVYVSTGNGSNPAFQQLSLTSGQALIGTLQPTSGGTGLSSIGSNNQVLTVSGTALVWNTVTVPGAVSSVSGSYPIYSTSGSTPTLSLSGAVPTVNGGTGLTTVGSTGQVLTVSGAALVYAAVPPTGVLSVSGSYPISSTSGANPILSLSGAVPYPNGGTGLTTLGSSGQVLTVSGAAVAWATPVAGGITSVSGSYPINSTSGTTPILSLSGAVPTANGGTGLTTVGTSGQVLTVSGTIPTWITPITGTGSVTSVSGSYPIFSTSGATPTLSLSGAVPSTNGGTGLTTLGTSGQVLMVSGGSSIIWGTSPSGFVNPMTSSGDLITGQSGGTATRLGIGSTNQVLTVSGGMPVWTASSVSGTFFAQSGNAFGASGVLGTTDKNALQFIVSGTTAVTISPTSGFVGIGTQYPTHPITLVSGSSGIAFYNTGDQLVSYERGTLQFINNNLLLGTEFGGSGQARMFRFGAASSAGSNIMSSGKTLNIAGTAPFFVLNASTSQNGNIMDYSSTSMSSSTGKQVALDVNPSVSQTAGGLFTAFLVNPTLTTQSSGTNLIVDFEASNISKFSVNSSGNVAIGPIVPNASFDVSGAMNIRAMAQPSVSSANQGTIYFDSSTGLYKVSQSGAAYINLVGLTNPLTTTGDVIYASGSTPTRLPIGSTNQILSVSGGVPVWTTSSAGGYTVPSVTILTSGTSGTYTTPSGCLYLIVEEAGGGGGGGGSGGSTGPNGNFGGATTFANVTALGGSPGAGAIGTNGGAGGTGGVNGPGSISGLIRYSGGPGLSGPAGTGLTGTDFGGAGGNAGHGFGGGGIEPPTATPGNAGNLYGGGGSGCGTGGSSGTSGGGGGGEALRFIINNPAASYTYTVGGSGAGGIGTGGGAETGGNGASGAIQLECHNQ